MTGRENGGVPLLKVKCPQSVSAARAMGQPTGVVSEDRGEEPEDWVWPVVESQVQTERKAEQMLSNNNPALLFCNTLIFFF